MRAACSVFDTPCGMAHGDHLRDDAVVGKARLMFLHREVDVMDRLSPAGRLLRNLTPWDVGNGEISLKFARGGGSLRGVEK